MDKVKEGIFYYARHRRQWGVWKTGKTSESGVRMDDFISDFPTRVQAEGFVYKMNNWKKKDQENDND